MRSFQRTATMSALVLLTAASSSLAEPSFFDVVSDSETVAGPPYPTSCHRALIAHETSGTYECDGRLDISIGHAADANGNHIDTSLLAGGEHPPGDGFWQDSFFDAMFHPEHQGQTLPEGSRFRLSLELTTGRGEPGTLVAIHPERHVCDPLRYFDVHANGWSVRILCIAELAECARHELALLAELPSTVMLTGTYVRIHDSTLGGGGRPDPTEPQGYFTARPSAVFDIVLCLEGGPGFDEAQPMTSVTATGRFLGGVSPVEATTWGTIKSMYHD